MDDSENRDDSRADAADIRATLRRLRREQQEMARKAVEQPALKAERDRMARRTRASLNRFANPVGAAALGISMPASVLGLATGLGKTPALGLASGLTRPSALAAGIGTTSSALETVLGGKTAAGIAAVNKPPMTSAVAAMIGKGAYGVGMDPSAASVLAGITKATAAQAAIGNMLAPTRAERALADMMKPTAAETAMASVLRPSAAELSIGRMIGLGEQSPSTQAMRQMVAGSSGAALRIGGIDASRGLAAAFGSAQTNALSVLALSSPRVRVGDAMRGFSRAQVALGSDLTAQSRLALSGLVGQGAARSLESAMGSLQRAKIAAIKTATGPITSQLDTELTSITARVAELQRTKLAPQRAASALGLAGMAAAAHTRETPASTPLDDITIVDASEQLRLDPHVVQDMTEGDAIAAWHAIDTLRVWLVRALVEGASVSSMYLALRLLEVVVSLTGFNAYTIYDITHDQPAAIEQRAGDHSVNVAPGAKVGKVEIEAESTLDEQLGILIEQHRAGELTDQQFGLAKDAVISRAQGDAAG